ncbi:FkbM family methyltransferase [candidate division WWE3 bacterium]|uniref:FkbM family methyltransferase n=1 Tax=candidate division WWE3 bacterium TaxID=2053526 RepID=A0A955LLI6_UNCKA|nr:FkbM family methyltransferase [candidate division WWE3 bacterium]
MQTTTEKLLQRALSLVQRLQGLGKSETYKYEVCPGVSFNVRRDYTDRFIIDEVFKLAVYGDVVKDASVIVDLGANIGAFSIYAATKATNAIVYSVEPEPANFATLQENVTLNNLDNVHLLNAAMGSRDGNVQLYTSNDNSGAHTLLRDQGGETVNVKSKRFETFMVEQSLATIDVLKIDVEGLEYEILDSITTETFAKIKSLLIEFHDLMGHGRHYTEIVNLLEKNGFTAEVHTPWWMAKFFKQGTIIARKG